MPNNFRNGKNYLSIHSFYRGGPLTIYEAETRQAINHLKGKIDNKGAVEVWEAALATTWDQRAVWVHGDISPGNLLVQKGGLSAVIDFGQLATGDPASDLEIAWTFFEEDSREIFRSSLSLDTGTWARSRAWALWKALIIAARLPGTNISESTNSMRIINEVIWDHRSKS